MTRTPVTTDYTARYQTWFIMTEALDFLMTEDNDFLVTEASLVSDYTERVVPTSPYSERTIPTTTYS